MLLLPLSYIIVFAYVPMAGAQIAFKDFTASGGIWGSKWVGLEHFARFFSSYQFGRVLKNTVTISVYTLVAGFPLPIIFALILNSVRRGNFRRVVQSITCMPHFISIVVLVSMVFQVLDPRIGVAGTLYALLTGQSPPTFIGMPRLFPHIYVWSDIWQHMGWNSVIYMAALSSVDVSLYEAAEIDGATRFQRILHIDLPSIIPTAIIILIVSSGQIMNIGFEKAFLMQNSLNVSASEVISTYVYKVGLASAQSNFSYATAIGLFNSVVNLCLILLVNSIARKASSQSLW
jgi:putative aldouronate transport system permease protein